MLDHKNLVTLGKTIFLPNKNPSGLYTFGNEQFTAQNLNDTMADELNQMLGSEELYEANKHKFFKLINEVADEVVPRKVEDFYGRFAEVRQYAPGQQAVFNRKLGRQRAKQFITRVGLAGRYQVFELSEEWFTVPTSAIGGAAGVRYEDIINGRVNFAELIQILAEGMEELIGKEIIYSMMAAVSQLPGANRVQVTGFDDTAMDFLLAGARAYGDPTIYCTMEFASKMMPSEANWYSNEMKNTRFQDGYLPVYKGAPVQILPQSFVDETNSTKVVDPGYCWIIPSGESGIKPVKVAFEGGQHTREVPTQNMADWAQEIHTYRKVGVRTLMTPNIFSYVDTTLLGQITNSNTKPEWNVTP